MGCLINCPFNRAQKLAELQAAGQQHDLRVRKVREEEGERRVLRCVANTTAVELLGINNIHGVRNEEALAISIAEENIAKNRCIPRDTSSCLKDGHTKMNTTHD